MIKPVLVVAAIVFLITAMIGCIWVFYSKRRGLREEWRPVESVPLAVPPVTLRGRYSNLYRDQAVPSAAGFVIGAAFSPGCEAVRQYCWLEDNHLVFLPLWESVESLFRGQPPESVPLYAIHIPLQNLDCYFEEENEDGKFTVLQYKSPQGATLSLGFTADAIRVFDAMIPDNARERRAERKYTRSVQNIQDINEIFLRLKELRRRDLITEDEYAEKKKHILLKM